MSDIRVGFIGVGSMGTPMVDRMLAAGSAVTVYARRAEVRDRFAAAGATVTDVIADAAAGNQVVLECLYSDAQGEELLLGNGGVIEALELAKQIGFPGWVEVTADKAEGVFKKAPDRDEFGSDINESLIVEMYSR